MVSLITKFILIKYAFYCMKNKVIYHLHSALPVFKVFEDDEDDDKFYSKLSQAQSSNYLEIWLRKLS